MLSNIKKNFYTKNIRNFCIIAHVDHGKTTMSDRLLEYTKTIDRREMKEQMLDSMELERERGITIKSHPVTMLYTYENKEYLLNLIDTPGHADFSYEVSRSLAACEGALLLIDASQGIEAQTISHVNLAITQRFIKIITIINKIDLPGINIGVIEQQIEDVLGIKREEVIHASGKIGIGIKKILNAIVTRIPEPRWSDLTKVRILIFNNVFDPYKGIICYVRVFSGTVRPGDDIVMLASGSSTKIKEVGRFSPKMKQEKILSAGCTGYIVTSIKNISEIKIGDTITLSSDPAYEALPGYKEARPMVFSSIYPLNTKDYKILESSIEILQLNDAALVYKKEKSVTLGIGFRCGFLGLLHMEIIHERLRREHGLQIIITYPSVIYRVTLKNGNIMNIDNPTIMPDRSKIKRIEEPVVRANINIPITSMGKMLSLINDKRGVCLQTDTINSKDIILICILPLSEILVDFYDSLKKLTKGYGVMDYDTYNYQDSELVKLRILINGQEVEAFSSIVHRKKSIDFGRNLCVRIKKVLPRQMFNIVIQAAIESKVIARETLSAFSKSVTNKCYGGDITRKMKLLEKQKVGKKRMKEIGKVKIPLDAFLQIIMNK